MLGAAPHRWRPAGLHTTQLFGKTIKHKPLDPVNPDILFGTTSSIWGGAGEGGKKTYDTALGDQARRGSSVCRASNSTAMASSSIAPTPRNCRS